MGLTSNLRDARLVGRALAHDSGAFGELVRKHMPAVSAVAMAYTKNHADAQDVVQEAFLKAWQSLDTLRVRQRFGGWVVTIARNVARSKLGQGRREAANLDKYETEAAMPTDPVETDSGAAMCELLPALVAELSEPDRELVMLRYHGGKKTREIAVLLSLSNAAVRKRLERVRLKLGQAMLDSLEPDPTEKTRRDRRASKITSVVVVVSPPWKNAITESAGPAALGGSTILKTIMVAFFLVAVPMAIFLNVRENAPTANPLERPAETPVENAETVAENARPTNLDVAEIPTGTDTPTPTPLAETSFIAGRLFEEDTGNGVLEGTIRLISADNAVRAKAKTDEKGHYRFDELAPGDYWIELSWDEEFIWRYPRSQHKTQEQSIRVERGASVSNVNFVVARGLTVRGRVVGPNGNALVEAVVKGWSRTNSAESETKTDNDGRFELHGFGTDMTAFFWPHYEGLGLPPHGPVTIPPEGIDNLVLTMRPESIIAGRLVDQDGNPLPEVRITPWPRNVSRLSKNHSVVTDNSGSFEARGLHKSSYHFTIIFPDDTSPRRLSNEELPLAESEHLRNVTLVYESPGNLSITGRILDDRGTALSGIRLSTQRGNEISHAKTDDQGFYELEDLDSGVYQVKALRLTRIGQDQSRAEAEAGARNVDFVFKRLATVHGRVIDAETERPIPVFEAIERLNPVFVLLEPDPVFRWTKFRNTEGRFKIPSLSPDAISLAARAEGYAIGTSERLSLTSGQILEDVVIRLEKAGSVSGRVLDPDGKPVRDAKVSTDDAFVRARTNADGKFVVADARPGTWSIRVSHPNYASGELPITVIAGEETVAEIHLGRGAQLRGTVSRNGKLLDNVSIELNQWLGTDTIGFHLNSRTDKEGNYTFAGIPAGELILHVAAIVEGQGRVVDAPVFFVVSEEKVVDIEIIDGTASAVFEIEMDEDLASHKGSLFVELAYQFESGETETFYNFVPHADEVRLEKLYPGSATLNAKYYAAGLSKILSTIEPREVTIQEDTENHFAITFTEPN